MHALMRTALLVLVFFPLGTEPDPGASDCSRCKQFVLAECAILFKRGN